MKKPITNSTWIHRTGKITFLILCIFLLTCTSRSYAAARSETLTYTRYGWCVTNSSGGIKKITTIARNSKGWWYVKNGKVNFSYTGFAKRQSDGTWWYVKKGKVQTSASGLCKGKVNGTSGTWYILNGKVRMTTTIYKKAKGTRYYVVKGRWQNHFTGYAGSGNNRWYFINGVAVSKVPVTKVTSATSDLSGTTGAYGSLSIPSKNFSVPLYSTDTAHAQSVVDAVNSAAYIRYWSKVPAIADHNVQGFHVLESVSVGSTKAYVVQSNGTYKTYICDAQYEGKRIAGNLYDTAGNCIQDRYDSGIVMYTCKSYPFVTITHWRLLKSS